MTKIERLIESIECDKKREYYSNQYLILSKWAKENRGIQTLNKNIFPRFIENELTGDLLERFKRILEIGSCLTLEKSILMYGEIEGKKKWENYRQIQAHTNTYEYKKKTKKWSKEQFDSYNADRSCTKENFIKRHGEIEGKKKWENYVERQKFAGSSEKYFIELFGEIEGKKKWESICQSKSLTKENFIKRHGEIEGKKKWEKYRQKQAKTLTVRCSKISQDFFWELYEKIPESLKEFVYFNELNKEYYKYDYENSKIYFFDFVITNKKIIIEFNGDYWHANPKKYNATDVLNFGGNHVQVSDIWERDEIKKTFAINHGYDILFIWESDFSKNKDDVIKSTIKEIEKINARNNNR